MSNASERKRTESALRVIIATNHLSGILGPEALVSWLPPKGMEGHIPAFEPREGGAQFLELVPEERIVQLAEFEFEDPPFAGAMTIAWSLAAVPQGIKVTIVCENVPEGMRQEDRDAGLASTLEKLAAFTE